MKKTIFKTLLDTIPDQTIYDSYFSSFLAVETDEGPGMAMYMPDHDSFSMARINAHYNQGCEYYEPYENYCTFGLDFTGKTVGVIGNMKGVRKRYGDIAGKIYVFDYEQEEGVLPFEMEEELLPTCDILVITGSSVINETVDHILEITPDAYRILVGPSVPMCPDLLDFGFDRLSGMVISDTEKMREHIKGGLHGSPYYFGTPFMIKKS